MRRSLVILAVLTALGVLAPVRAATRTVVQDRVWFCPGPGTLDYLQLFEHPEQWPHARQLMNVFKFYQQHTQTPAPSIVGPNSYDALVRAGAFKTLTTWGKKIAIEAGSVKTFYCTPDASGMNASIQSSVDSISAVEAAGGTVSYIAMDEPFVSGRDRVCGGPALEPTADRVAVYVAGVTAAKPGVRIGLIEAYPFSSASAIQTIVQMLEARGASPAFLHMDVDWHLAGSAAFRRDMAALKAFAASQHIPFGVIIVGYNGEADALYAVDAYGISELLVDTFSTWDQMPDHLIFQSFVQTSTGLFITPTNLPESRPFTHTAMAADIVRRLRGSQGSSTGTAIIRK